MRIIYFGTSDFAVSPLLALLAQKVQILKVVTAPDKKKGRGLTLGASAVKLLAQENKLALLQPQTLKDAKFIQALKNESADLFVVCAYGKILTKEILAIPKKFAVNLHASLLPKYRGAAPVNWAIVKDEKESGVTVFKMNEYMDRGEIILQRKTNISSDETSLSLGERLSELAAQLLVEAIELIKQDKAIFRAQDESQASLAPKLKKDDGLIDWKKNALEIHNRIRGLQPWPGAFTYLEGKLLKIWSSRIVCGEKQAQPGQILEVNEEKGILVQTGKDKLLLTEVQLEGKRRMPAQEFVLGYKIKTGIKLGANK